MFAADDEDGDFMSPSGGAKLASLFSLDQPAGQANESFQYMAPKQPRKSSGLPAQNTAPPAGSPAVLFATAVHAYRYINGQYMKQGKLGAAVLGNHTAQEYKLLLYVSQQKPVTAARIHSAFSFTVQPSNYCSFYDDQRQNWSLMFESEKAATDFCKEVCLAKANCASPLEMLVTQDLVLGEGQGVENGDTLEVAYTGWLLQNHTFGQMFDSNLNKDKLLRLKLGAGKVIKGWEEGMLNMCKGGRRLLVIPPAMAYGSQGVPGRVPADSTLVFEAEIRRVKFVKDTSSEKTAVSSRDTAVPSPAPSMESLGLDLTSAASRSGELPLRAKSNSLSEQLANPDATKAKLISRMAKMGQPMLPFLTGPASSSSQAESSDSELEDPSVSRHKERPPAPSPQPVHLISGVSASLQGTALMPVSMATASPQPVIPVAGHGFQPYSYTPSTTAQSHLQPLGQIYPSQTVPYQGSGDVTSFLMTEARQHNTEIRLAVSKVGDKVDQLATKMEELHKQGGLSLGLSNVSMDTVMIMNTIQRIIQENECLKKEVFEKSSRIEEQNRKIGELINQNQRCMEQSNMLMEQRNDSLKNSSEQNQTRILQAEQEKVRLTDELASSTARVSALQLELTTQCQKAAALQSSLNTALQEGQQHGAQLTATENQLQEMKELAERVQAQYRAEKQKRKEVELKLSNLDEELQDLKSEKESLERALVDRKRKWQAERQRCDEELEEVRKSSQMEMDQLWSQLRKARTSTDQVASEQLAQLQADVECEWQAKCEQALASAREQQKREVMELTEQRDALQLKLTQLQDKFSAFKQSREEEERLLQQQDKGEELQALRDKCCELEKRAESLRQQGQARVSELERRLAEQRQQTDTTGEVKRVMNGVFQSLRGEFELHETYTGSEVLSVLVNTIKNVTLQLLSKSEPSSTKNNKKEEDEDEEEEERKSEAQSKEQDNHTQELHMNGKKEDMKEEGEEEEDGQVQVTEEKSKAPETVEEDKEEKKGREEVVRGKVEENVGQEVVSSKVEEKGGQEDVRGKEEEKGGQEVVRGKEEGKGGQEVVSSKVEEKGGQEDVRGKEEEKGGQEDIRGKEEENGGQEVIRITKDMTSKQEVEGAKEEAEAGELVYSDIRTQIQTQDDVILKEEVNTGVLDDLTPEEDVMAKRESTLGLSDESGPDENIHTGPPTNPPPPPNPTEQDGTETSAQPSSPSEQAEGVKAFFQSPVQTKPPPLPTSEEEEEEELSLKGRPPPTPLFGDDSDDDDLDWLS